MDAQQTITELVEICRLVALISPETDEEISAMGKIFEGIGEMQECMRLKNK